MRLRQGTELRLEISGEVRPQLMKRETGFGSQHFFLDRLKHAALPQCFKSFLIPSPSRRYGYCFYASVLDSHEPARGDMPH